MPIVIPLRGTWVVLEVILVWVAIKIPITTFAQHILARSYFVRGRLVF